MSRCTPGAVTQSPLQRAEGTAPEATHCPVPHEDGYFSKGPCQFRLARCQNPLLESTCRKPVSRHLSEFKCRVSVLVFTDWVVSGVICAV